MKKHSITISIILVILFGVIGFNYYKVLADSGWDSSYDSGSDSSSSWDSGSSRDSSSNWNSSSGGHKNKSSVVVYYIVYVTSWFIAFAFIGFALYAHFTRTKNTDNLRIDVGPVDVNIPGFDETKFLELAYQIFLDVQKAWMNMDYEALQRLLSDELFNTYKAQLKALELKKQRNEMSNFELIDHKITGFEESENNYTIKTGIIVKFYDYVVDENNKVIRGSNKKRILISYELTFVGSKDEKPNKCPNCGTPLNNEASTQCPNCKSTIVNEHHDFVLTKKQTVFQSKE